MKHIFNSIWLLAILCSSEAAAQKVSFSYDNAGNRIKREIVLSPKSAPTSQDDAHETQPISDMLADKDIRIHPNPTTGML